MHTPLKAISPLDGRYQEKTNILGDYFSEYALIYHRLLVEIRWIQALAAHPAIKECPAMSDNAQNFLEELLNKFDLAEAEKVKTIESRTNHDVKAVEYYLKEQCQPHPELKAQVEFIHFALTSEDVNNLAYALMTRKASTEVLFPKTHDIIDTLTSLAKEHANAAMLSRTHGQSASPTTLGKELANVLKRLQLQLEHATQIDVLGKCNGAVGNYNAHYVAYPKVDWESHSRDFIQSLGLVSNPYTTQIEPHDWLANLCNALFQINIVLIDFSRDCWTYISLGYFKQRLVKEEVGSSTMPHKVNPIDFENAEGNFGLANALYHFFAAKLPISRLQRDLSDSTVMRNLGVAFGHSFLAMQSLQKGLSKLSVDAEKMAAELSELWVLLAEPLQTVMRRYGVENSYEKLKDLTRGESLTQKALHDFIDELSIPDKEKARMKALTPLNYLGNASMLTQSI